MLTLLNCHYCKSCVTFFRNCFCYFLFSGVQVNVKIIIITILSFITMENIKRASSTKKIEMVVDKSNVKCHDFALSTFDKAKSNV